MTLVYRLVKGSKLTAAEGDGNIHDLDDRLTAIEDNPPEARGIESVEPSGNQLSFLMTDSTTEGPFTITVNGLNPMGEWAPATPYAVLDFFLAPNGNTYVVRFAHTSAGSFDPGANDGDGHDYYELLFSMPSLTLPAGGTTGQVVAKASGTSFDLELIGPLIPDDGEEGQIPRKLSVDPYDIEWAFPGDFISLADLADVEEPSPGPDDGDLLSFNDSAGVWSPLAPSDLTFTPSQVRNDVVTSLGTTGTVSLDPTLGDVFTVTPTGSITLNAASAPAGARISIVVLTSGTSSYNITPTTNFISAGALATGTVSGKYFVITFVGDGTKFYETGRTAAM